MQVDNTSTPVTEGADITVQARQFNDFCRDFAVPETRGPHPIPPLQIIDLEGAGDKSEM